MTQWNALVLQERKTALEPEYSIAFCSSFRYCPGQWPTLFSIAGHVAIWQRDQLSTGSTCKIMMYKNFMDRRGQKLEISIENIECCYDDLSEIPDESVKEEEAMVKTLDE
jgi:hypothetical protein